MKHLATFSIGFSVILGVLYTGFKFTFESKDDALYLGFLYEIRPMYIVLICLVAALPSCVFFLLEERIYCYERIGSYLTQQTMINRCKKNGHGNPYTEEEQAQMDQLSGMIRKFERRARLIEALLITWWSPR